MRSTFIALAVGVVLSPAALTQAFADRAPTADEQAKIEQALKDEGFTQWDEIEFDDDRVWEVDDAVGADGQKFDVRLDESFKIVDRRPD